LIAAGGIAFAALGSSSSSPVPVTIVAPAGASLGQFSVLKPDGADMKDVSGAGTRSKIRLSPGKYSLSFSDSAFRMPIPLSVSGSAAELRLGQLGSFVRIHAPGHSIPAFSVNDEAGKDVTDVDTASAKTGVYLLAGKYSLQFQYNSHYTGGVPLTVRTAGTQLVNLDRSMTYFKIVPPHGLPLNGVEVDNTHDKYFENLGEDAANLSGLQAINAGRYHLSLGSPYLGPIPFVGRAGKTTVLKLADIYGHLTVTPPSSVAPADFSLNDPKTGVDRWDVKGTDAQNGVFVRPGRYLINFDSSSQFVMPLPITLSRARTEDIRPGRVFGRITVAAFPGSPLPAFNLVDVTSKKTLIYGVDKLRAEEGLFVAPGHYQIALDSGPGYLDSVTVSAAAGKLARVSLVEELGAMQIVPAPHVPLSLFAIDNIKGQTLYSVSSMAPGHVVYLKAGTYTLDFSGSSNRFVGLPTIRVAVGRVNRVRLLGIFASVDVPRVSGSNTLTFTWHDQLGSREIDATAQPQRMYVALGSYSVAVSVSGQGHLQQLNLIAGRTTRLPTK
jgi:hypothetical protein